MRGCYGPYRGIRIIKRARRANARRGHTGTADRMCVGRGGRGGGESSAHRLETGSAMQTSQAKPRCRKFIATLVQNKGPAPAAARPSKSRRVLDATNTNTHTQAPNPTHRHKQAQTIYV